MKNSFSNTILILGVLFLCITTVSCQKDKTDTFDITQSKWKLKYISINNTKITPLERRWHMYVLEFTNDSFLQLNLSVNSGGGKYQISSLGNITIALDAYTELCCDNDFDLQLIGVAKQITTYKVLGNKLIFKGSDTEIVFKKKFP
ncbi:MAG: META domain-containing protein [Flavobacteriales bacterium]|nr:META domain-containing protein [Flavobacteriales bacterium]